MALANLNHNRISPTSLVNLDQAPANPMARTPEDAVKYAIAQGAMAGQLLRQK
ncbi:hypothetical protein GF1_16760 [Desulfolithobacter dissulfuricans]|uniref:Uncharacterized protein n=1 Tax=Desulfolithobacter dissulfuricans TaxID=2795293 RepID=A0A915U1Y3_9BACT|nr:hypothetical protein GF1_16760 [Desulfolithobacter dissulfuricans]